MFWYLGSQVKGELKLIVLHFLEQQNKRTCMTTYGQVRMIFAANKFWRQSTFQIFPVCAESFEMWSI